MARSTGIKSDLRLCKYTKYNSYFYINFYSIYSNSGDSYSRYLIRMYEMIESVSIINQSLLKLKNLFVKKKNNILYINSMENTIKLFKY